MWSLRTFLSEKFLLLLHSARNLFMGYIRKNTSLLLFSFVSLKDFLQTLSLVNQTSDVRRGHLGGLEHRVDQHVEVLVLRDVQGLQSKGVKEKSPEKTLFFCNF